MMLSVSASIYLTLFLQIKWSVETTPPPQKTSLNKQTRLTSGHNNHVPIRRMDPQFRALPERYEFCTYHPVIALS